MYNTLIKVINKPFKMHLYLSNKIVISVSYGLFIFTFLALFEPFKLDLLKEYFLGYIFTIAIFYTIVPLFFFFIINKLKLKNWTLGNVTILYFVFTLILSLVTWLASGIYKDAVHYLKKLPFLKFYEYTMFVSFVSTPLFMIYNEQINQFKTKKRKKPITLFSENKKELLNININELIYISVSGNYTSFYVMTNDKIKELILRNTLTDVYQQIKKQPNIFKCHKSFIINTNYIDGFSGNSRGYLVKMKSVDVKIPVSRKFTKEDLNNLLH
ncbi:HTH LytTR-type domain-containing protein [Tenacibaculum insulae]